LIWKTADYSQTIANSPTDILSSNHKSWENVFVNSWHNCTTLVFSKIWAKKTEKIVLLGFKTSTPSHIQKVMPLCHFPLSSVPGGFGYNQSRNLSRHLLRHSLVALAQQPRCGWTAMSSTKI